MNCEDKFKKITRFDMDEFNEEPKIKDINGKELTAKEIQEYAENKKIQDQRNIEYLQEHKDDAFFEDLFPRKRG